jgi:hypothetical protein
MQHDQIRKTPIPAHKDRKRARTTIGRQAGTTCRSFAATRPIARPVVTFFHFPRCSDAARVGAMANEIQTQASSWFTKFRARLRCWRGEHAPNRQRVRKDGIFFTAKCQSCGIPIRKKNGRPWKPYTP